MKIGNSKYNMRLTIIIRNIGLNCKSIIIRKKYVRRVLQST